MSMYNQFRQLNMDFSPLGLIQENTRSDYFCTPKYATVIGWEGVDGIHYCFIKRFGEMVFAVNPSNLPGKHVHPLAWNFVDFLRLILACGGTAGAEQAWMWSREAFDAFIESSPTGPEQQAALDALRDRLSITPMEDPYGYIRSIQDSFDYTQIPYRKAYYACITQQPKNPDHPAWNVYFANGFFAPHTGRGRPGLEAPVHQTFTWGGKVWHIPSIYTCGKGMVIDFCVEIDPADLQAFFQKWRPRWEEGSPLTPEEQDMQHAENPMTIEYEPELTLNGKLLRRCCGYGLDWIPISCRAEPEQTEPGEQDLACLRIMEHYGLDPQRGWMFYRDCFSRVTKIKPVLKDLSLHLAARPVPVPGPRFAVSGKGDTVSFTHPVTGAAHTLRVVDYHQEISVSHMQKDKAWEYPTHYTAMSYVVEPELPRESLCVQDCQEGDHPRRRTSDETEQPAALCCAQSVISSADGPATVILTSGKNGHTHTACSALRFAPQAQIQWRIVFHQTLSENMVLNLPL